MSNRNKPSQPSWRTLLPIVLVLSSAFAAGSPLPLVGTRTVEEPAAGEMNFVPTGVNLDPDWGLNKVGARWKDGPVYTYVDTTNPVRLYLIDTAVANPGDWIGKNPNITFEGTILVRGYLDPTTSSQFGHGTRMLSLICDLKAGVAPGTPINVMNYDVYPSGLTTSAGKLASAVYDAVSHYRNTNPRIPSVICIASSSSLAGTSSTLRSAISAAIAEGVTVIVSAGNNGLDASNYIPSSYGTMQGVISVGASDSTDSQIDISNFGTPVTMLAPGDNVLVKHETQLNYVRMRGTSPAAAMVTGSALAELSMDGSLTPAELEAKIIATGVPSKTVGAPPVLRTTPVIEAP